MQYITQRFDGKGNLISETRVDLTPKDIAREWAGIRQERNLLLAESDWTRLDDTTADKEAWATYRQALRDITLQPNPLEVQWPVVP